MDTQLVQRTRYLLKARVKYALTCPPIQIQAACRQWLTWITAHAIFGSIVARIETTRYSWESMIDEIGKFFIVPRAKRPNLSLISPESHAEQAAFCFRCIKLLAETNLYMEESTAHEKASAISQMIKTISLTISGNESERTDEAYENLREVVFKGLYEYLDEQLDARNALLGLLLKYKHRSEWFRKYRLRDIATNGLEYKKDGGERALAIDLYEYVFDQGVDFSIEPKSASGEADLIGRDSEGRHIVIDAKYISPSDTPSEIKKKLSVGFHQVARYCEDHNESYGYLVPYINHRKSLRLPLEETDGFRYLTVKGKIIYYIPVDIGDHPSASQSGPADEIDISKDELLKETTDATASIVATDKT
jgi:hypothetical protein